MGVGGCGRPDPKVRMTQISLRLSSSVAAVNDCYGLWIQLVDATDC